MNKIQELNYFIFSNSKLIMVYVYSQKESKSDHIFEGQSENLQVIQARRLGDWAGTELAHGQDKPKSHKMWPNLMW